MNRVSRDVDGVVSGRVQVIEVRQQKEPAGEVIESVARFWCERIDSDTAGRFA